MGARQDPLTFAPSALPTNYRHSEHTPQSHTAHTLTARLSGAQQGNAMTTPRIYVACLASYNAGILHGEWTDATDHDVVQECIARVLSTSPTHGAEEYAIHDHEGFGSFKVSEWPDLEDLCKLGAAIDKYGAMIADLMSHLGEKDVDAAISYMEDNYQGTWRTLEDWAENWLEDTGALAEVPESMRPYIDVEKWARDAELGGDIFTIEGGDGVHVFTNS